MPNVITERANGSRRVIRHVEGESKTEQHHKDEVNINNIIAKYEKTGQVPVSMRPASYGDFTGVSDYHSAMDSVLYARDAFMSLPAEVRKRFANDPGNLIDFLDDPENAEEAMQLGIIERPQPEGRLEENTPESPTEPPEEPQA